MTSGSVLTARDPTYTTTDKLRCPRQIEAVHSLRAFPFTRPCIYQLGPQVQARMYSHRLQCIRNGIKKKITLDLNQLKATLKKIILHPKRKIITVGVSFLIDRHFVFFSGWRIFFFIDCLLVAKKKPPSCTHLLNVNLFHLEKEDTKLI